MYEKQLEEYIKNRLAKNRRSVQLLGGDDLSLLRVIQTAWELEFCKNKCKELEDKLTFSQHSNRNLKLRVDELDRVMSGMSDVIDGKDGEISDLEGQLVNLTEGSP